MDHKKKAVMSNLWKYPDLILKNDLLAKNVNNISHICMTC